MYSLQYHIDCKPQLRLSDAIKILKGNTARWLTADALKNSAVAGNMFETFVVSEILKTYSNEGKDYRFNIFYYRGKDKTVSNENEIDELPPHTRDCSRE